MTAEVRWYLDTGVWVTPLLANQPKAVIDACLAWQRRCATGEIAGVASTLVWDEVTFVAGRRRGLPFDFAAAAYAGALWRALPGLTVVDVNAEVLDLAQLLLQRHRLKPRDCIHAAAALIRAEGRLVTLDGDFPQHLALPGLAPLVAIRLAAQGAWPRVASARPAENPL